MPCCIHILYLYHLYLCFLGMRPCKIAWLWHFPWKARLPLTFWHASLVIYPSSGSLIVVSKSLLGSCENHLLWICTKFSSHVWFLVRNGLLIFFFELCSLSDEKKSSFYCFFPYVRYQSSPKVTLLVAFFPVISRDALCLNFSFCWPLSDQEYGEWNFSVLCVSGIC